LQVALSAVRDNLLSNFRDSLSMPITNIETENKQQQIYNKESINNNKDPFILGQFIQQVPGTAEHFHSVSFVQV
jgi:hypothetical protein